MGEDGDAAGRRVEGEADQQLQTDIGGAEPECMQPLCDTVIGRPATLPAVNCASFAWASAVWVGAGGWVVQPASAAAVRRSGIARIANSFRVST